MTKVEDLVLFAIAIKEWECGADGEWGISSLCAGEKGCLGVRGLGGKERKTQRSCWSD